MPRVNIEKLVFGGQALARLENKVCFVWGALPGEEVDIEITKEKKNFAEGEVVEVINPSEDRVNPLEEHYLACSPWQILEWSAENHWKEEIAKEVWLKNAKIELEPKIVFDDNDYNYRNKMTFRIEDEHAGKIGLALCKRDSNDLILVKGCALGDTKINQTFTELVALINGDDDLLACDKVVIRSNRNKEVMVGVYKHHKLVKQFNNKFLAEMINDVSLSYGLESFFQVNVPMFEKTLEDIKTYIGKNDSVIDYYSGVGAISLPLHKFFKEALLVEENAEAASFAKKNIKHNKISNCKVLAGKAERNLQLIESGKTLIVDPPRTGLNKLVIDRVLKVKPKKIIYLACDLATQARDVNLLQEEYKIKFTQLYNYFPKTPHFESLVVLELR